MSYAKLVVTAADEHWLNAAVNEFIGYGASVIGCDAEIAVEKNLTSSETIDGRVGSLIAIYGFGSVSLGKAITTRVGQCVMTCPSTAVYDGLSEGEKQIPLGKHIRFFGDTFQKSKQVNGTRFWRIPVMDGEFIVQDKIHVNKGIGGGNFIIQTTDQPSGLAAARRAGEAIASAPDVISPFAGGVVRSGSKVGSRYKALRASTSDAYCPTLRGRVESKLYEGVNCAYEVVIDGVDFAAVAAAMELGIKAAIGEGVVAISAGNYGGKLGKHHFHLKDLQFESQ